MDGAAMPYQITGERLTSLFRPRSVALVGASDKSAFSGLDPVRKRKQGGGGRRGGDDLHGEAAALLPEALGDDLESLEVNPLLVDGAVIEALDAVGTWKGQKR